MISDQLTNLVTKKFFLKLKLTLSAPKRVKIEDCKLIFLSFFAEQCSVNMIHNGIPSEFFVEFILFDVRITFISIMTSAEV